MSTALQKLFLSIFLPVGFTSLLFFVWALKNLNLSPSSVCGCLPPLSLSLSLALSLFSVPLSVESGLVFLLSAFKSTMCLVVAPVLHCQKLGK